MEIESSMVETSLVEASTAETSLVEAPTVEAIQLTPPKAGIIRTIIHLSDIHIRNGDHTKSRYNEYLGVFQNAVKMISQNDDVINGKAVIIVTGDFFETKNKLES